MTPAGHQADASQPANRTFRLKEIPPSSGGTRFIPTVAFRTQAALPITCNRNSVALRTAGRWHDTAPASGQTGTMPPAAGGAPSERSPSGLRAGHHRRQRQAQNRAQRILPALATAPIRDSSQRLPWRSPRRQIYPNCHHQTRSPQTTRTAFRIRSAHSVHENPIAGSLNRPAAHMR